MSFNKLAVMAAMAAVLPICANAQTLSGAQAAEPRPVGKVSVDTLNLATSAAAFQPQRAALPARGFFVKAHVGAWTNAGSGLTLGGGIGALPFDNDQHELTGNLSYLRVEGFNGFML